MSKTLNLSDIEAEALVKLLQIHQDNWNQYGKDNYGTARRVALVVLRSILRKLDIEPAEPRE